MPAREQPDKPYEASSTNSRTRLDIALAHSTFDVPSNIAMTLLSSGRVGIGATSPDAMLHVKGASGNANIQIGGSNTGGNHDENARIRITDGDTVPLNIQVAGQTARFTTNTFTSGGGFTTPSNTGVASWSMRMSSNSDHFAISRASATAGIPSFTDHLYINSSGNVAVGTTSATSQFTAYTTGSSPVALFSNAGAVTSSPGVLINAGSTDSDYGLWVRDRAASSTLLMVQGDGNVGIGTALPTKGRLVVTQTDAANDEAIYIDSEESSGGQNVFVIETDNIFNDTIAFRITADGTAYQNGADIAEMYLKTEELAPGDVVASTVMNTGGSKQYGVKKYDPSGNDKILGVVSTRPGNVLGSPGRMLDMHKYAPIGLAGRVPVKVTNENGAIMPGDFLTASKLFSGYAMLATESGEVIGQALEPFNSTQSNDSGMVEVFLKVAWQHINNTIALDAPSNTSASNGMQGGESEALAASSNSSTYIINQKVSQDNAVADILQLQSGNVNRLMVANTGEMTLNAAQDCMECNVLTVKNNDSELFTISATGTVTLAGHIVIEDDSVAGSIVTGPDGLAEITFINHLGTGKPVALLTPEGYESAFAQVMEWKQDDSGNYTGFVIRALGYALEPVQSTVNYLVVGKPAGYQTYGLESLDVSEPSSSGFEIGEVVGEDAGTEVGQQEVPLSQAEPESPDAEPANEEGVEPVTLMTPETLSL